MFWSYSVGCAATRCTTHKNKFHSQTLPDQTETFSKPHKIKGDFRVNKTPHMAGLSVEIILRVITIIGVCQKGRVGAEIGHVNQALTKYSVLTRILFVIFVNEYIKSRQIQL